MSLRKQAAALGATLLGVLFAIAPASAEITYYHNDLAGSPVVATNEAGTVIWRESYRPYGERLTNAAAAAGNKVWFTSRHQEATTGLVYMGARYYDPVVGRFISTDPVGFDEKNLHSHNRYAYANNNPYKYIDPDGNTPVHVAAWIAARAIAERVVTFALTRGGQAAVTAGEVVAGDAIGAGSLAAGAAVGAKAASKAADEAGALYRAGGSNPGNLKARAGEDGVSFRDSLSNPVDARERPIFRPGDSYIEVDAGRLPRGSVLRDADPPGHVTVKGASPEQIRSAITEKGRLPDR